MHPIKIRSYALAAFVLGRGIAPIDAVLIDGRAVFLFPPSADPVMDEYSAIKVKLDSLARNARPVVTA